MLSAIKKSKNFLNSKNKGLALIFQYIIKIQLPTRTFRTEIIKRDSICIGQVAKIDTLIIKNRKFTPSIYKAYRSILFNIDSNGLCNDLIYDSPKYTILNYEDKEIKTMDEKENPTIEKTDVKAE